MEAKDLVITSLMNGSNWFPKTTGIKITHTPSGISVEEVSDRSQHRNKFIAYSRLEVLVAEWEANPYSESPDSYLAEITQLRADLAEREAECLQLRETLAYHQGQTRPIQATVDALSTPQSSSYLEQWEKSRYGEPVWYHSIGIYGESRFYDQVETKPEGSTPLYTRKEK